jgi:hypothetical protein
MKVTSRRFLGIMLAVTAGVALLLFGLFRFLQEEENYSRIEDRLYLGGTVAASPRGTRAVINLCDIEDPYRCEFHLWEPIVDGEPAPDLDWLRRMVDVLDARQREGMTTYVHCRNGVSRSGLLVVAYEMRKNNWTRDEALVFVRARRPITRPNPAFMRLLLEWERVIKGEPITSSSARSVR